MFLDGSGQEKRKCSYFKRCVFFLFHVHVCFACMYIHVPWAWRCQEMSKRASDTLEMELQIARSHQVGAGSWTQVLFSSNNQLLSHGAVSPAFSPVVLVLKLLVLLWNEIFVSRRYWSAELRGTGRLRNLTGIQVQSPAEEQTRWSSLSSSALTLCSFCLHQGIINSPAKPQSPTVLAWNDYSNCF